MFFVKKKRVFAVVAAGLFCAAGVFAKNAVSAPESSPEPQAVSGQEETVSPKKEYAPYPAPETNYVSDYAGLLSEAQKKSIAGRLGQVEERTKVEITVVTIAELAAYPGTENSSVEAFATALFNRWGIGNLPKNDGVLLLVAVKNRRCRIELGKFYGHAYDSRAQKIMDSTLLPAFRRGDYASGIDAAVNDMAKEFAGCRFYDAKKMTLLLGGIVGGIAVLAFVAFSLFKRGKNGWGWVVVCIIGFLVIFALRMVAVLLRSRRGVSRGGFGGGFGGGSSGGGGASGGW